MKKRYFLLSLLLILTALLSYGKYKLSMPSTSEKETWETAPEFSAPLITTTSIRCLSVTVGSTEEEVNLTWLSPSEEAGQVYWTTADDTEFMNAAVFGAQTVPSAITSGYYLNRVTVTGLMQETDYIYQVGNEQGLSPVYSYATPSFSNTFRFTAVGDIQLGKPMEELDSQKNTWHKLLNKVKYHFPYTSFLVSLGDQVNNFDDTEQYNAVLDHASLYSLPLAPVKGNHDMGGPQYSEHFTLPNQSTLGNCDDEGDGDYWFTRGSALFIVLNTMNTDKWNEHAPFIESAVEANPEAKWRIVFSHYSPYNAYKKYMENAQEIRPYFLKFTDDYDIDLVISGHDHAYTRTYFIQKDGSYQEYKSPAVDPEGTMYLILSSSSGSLYHQPSSQNESAISRKREVPEVTDVQITPDKLKISTYLAETWELLDEFEIRKTDIP